MAASIAMLADFIEHLLHYNKLIWNEGIVDNKIGRPAIPLYIEHTIGKCKQIFKYGIVLAINLFEYRHRFRLLF